MAVLEHLTPQDVFYYFEKISSIPRGSGNMEQISNYLVSFAKEHGLEYVQDEMYNVMIRKPASAGYEDAPGVILQGHMDMVCEKTPESAHDFEKEGLKLEILDDTYVSAKETTLGGDNGIAIAYGLALLAGEYEHPEIELLVTVDEEIGLLGAAGFDCSVLRGKRLLNLDSEEEGFLLTSCAGGASAVTHLPVQRVTKEGSRYTVKVAGLLGGHSGVEIDKNRGNANVLMGRFLYELKKTADYEIASLFGGQKDNAIPRECTAVLLIADGQEQVLTECAAKVTADLKGEYLNSEEDIAVSVQAEGSASEEVLTPGSREKVLFLLMNLPNGIQKMSGTIPGLVETSSNIGIAKLEEEEFVTSSSVRSSVAAAKDALIDKMEYLTEFLGGECEVLGAYPAWEYNPHSPFRDLMIEVYEQCYGKKPVVSAIHAGLECGLFYEHIPGLECVSLGPDMKNVHTSEELLDIASTKRVWEYLLKVLQAAK